MTKDMTKVKYAMLLNKSEQAGNQFKGFQVVRFIASEDTNCHSFVITDDSHEIVVGLPIPRSMHPRKTTSGELLEINKHPSRSVEWAERIAAGELFWKPIKNEKSIKPGVFRHIQKEVVKQESNESGNRVDDLVKEINGRANKGMEM